MRKRESIDPKPGDRRSVGRDEKAHFSKEQDDDGLATKNRRSHATAKNESPWHTFKMPEYLLVHQDLHADVCIVGAGIAGLSTAYLLARAGQSVAVLDDGGLASGMTSVTTAHLASAIDDRYYEIERLHGSRGAEIAAESHSAAIDCIEENIKREKISCDFERLDGYLFLSPGETEALLDRELAAAHRAGLCGVEKVERAPLASFDTGPCLRFPNQGQFHPLKYLAGLAKAIERMGGRLFTRSHAGRIEGAPPSARVEVGDYVITAKAVVVATNTPINDLVALHTKQTPYMTYVIGARVPRGSVTKALYWDTGAVSEESRPAYHYVRLLDIPHKGGGNGQAEYQLLIVGGEDHRSGQAGDQIARQGRLEAWARDRFPMMEKLEFVWGGQVMETMDGLAFIGRNPLDSNNIFVATGDSGMGMTHGTIAGLLLTDLITGRTNPWADLYDPSRKTLKAAGIYAKETFKTVVQYADWLTGGDVSSTDEIALDSGAVLRRGFTKVAVYRDDRGRLHEMAATCPHLGCIVHWNQAEKSWDCPCHGSRFTAKGDVINGPANTSLAPVGSKERREASG
jgi:glycine/D-amino acid oxidase-like deaminating enzyme/nitrite reductase/ring-hydroxylating ferredoxin subunit